MAGGFKDHFSARAPHYAAWRPAYPEALGDFLAGLVEERRLALDCGCGTGQLAVRLAGRFETVVATDASPQQIAHAVPCRGVEYRVARAEASGMADGSVDLVTAAQAAHWFEQDAFHAELRRVLEPGGAVALVTYGAIEAEGEPGIALDDFHRRVVGFWPPERRHVETGYRSLPFPFREEAAPAIAMTVAWSLQQLLGYVGTWSAVRRAEAALGREPFESFSATLAGAWGDPLLRREMRWPLHMRIGRP